jgi:hypothetical protein
MQPEDNPNAGQSAESLENRLRALPPLSVPPDLEDRIVRSTDEMRPVWRRRLVLWGSAAVLAAACLLVVLAWTGAGSSDRMARRTREHPTRGIRAPLSDDSRSVSAPKESIAGLDDLPPFVWPLQETQPVRGASTSIPADLLN